MVPHICFQNLYMHHRICVPENRSSGPLPSWMASWGAPTCKPSRLWGTPPQSQTFQHLALMWRPASVSPEIGELNLIKVTYYLTPLLYITHPNSTMDYWGSGHIQIFFSIQVCFVLPLKLDSLSGIGWPRSIAPSTRINEKNLRKPLKGWRLLPRSAMQKENWWCHNLKLDAIQAHMLG